ncbi:hypothetical protein RB593_006582 [Gaeumannomyces tritici]
MAAPAHHADGATKAYFDHSSAQRVSTDTVLARALKEQYPQLELVITPESNCALFAFALSGHAALTPIDDAKGGHHGGGPKSAALPSSLSWDVYLPPARRLDGARGGIAERLLFGKFLYRWRDAEFIIYLADGRDGSNSYPAVTNYYVLCSPAERPAVDDLLLAAGAWTNELHDEVWVFDGGYWRKSAELYDSIRKASWDNVILDPSMKKAIIDDHLSFYGSRDTYASLKVPWKRGVIYYGPPGNGKTISIKATMRMLYDLKDPVPTLYVRILASFGGPEAALASIFGMARRYAPCYLVFEDLDTIVGDDARSYFLNEIDGLKANDGIFIVGSTNHLDRLDPGISKRPSRFDRKYFFPDPDREQRVAYCHFWQRKLADNKDVDFPDPLCGAIADITDKFSFAYMQEAFVASLLAIARENRDGDGEGMLEDDWVGVSAPRRLSSGSSQAASSLDSWADADDDGELDKLVLWVQMKKQVKILREGMDDKSDGLSGKLDAVSL